MKTEVCIIGAGPAGSTASLYLSKHGVDHVLIDKSTFPRNIVCGEALRGSNIYWALHHLDESYFEELKFKAVQQSYQLRLINRNNEKLTINLGETSSLMGRRIDFDNFLIQKVRNSNHCTFLEGQQPKNIEYIPNRGYELNVNDEVIKCKLLICATGTTSTIPQKLGISSKKDLTRVIGIRAHYRGIDLENGSTDIYFLDILKGGYFWIFPLYDGYFNVGLAVKDKDLKANNWKVKELFQQCIEHPNVSGRFKNATLEEKGKGKFLYLPSKKIELSNAHLMIAGAAGMAVNPITGYGVGHSMTMGRFAANHAVEALKANDFSASFLKRYDSKILKKLRQERWVASIKTNLLTKNNLVTRLIGFFSKNKSTSQLIQREDFAANFYNPKFYFKHFFK
jgi:flavin-dependent dehydrogenase